MAYFDIPGAFLHAAFKEGNTSILLDGQMIELVVMIDPKLHHENIHNLYCHNCDRLFYMVKYMYV